MIVLIKFLWELITFFIFFYQPPWSHFYINLSEKHKIKLVWPSYLTVIVVHEMHGRMLHNHCQITNLLAHDPPFIIGLPYDDPPPSPSQQLAYKNFGC